MTLRSGLAARVAAGIAAAVCAAAGARCGDNPVSPSPALPPPNAPPVVRSVTPSWNQVDAGKDVELTVVAEDAETPPELLLYSWSAEGGTFTGQGRTVRWKAPVDGPVPRDYTITVTVGELYNAQSGALAEHRVTGTSPPIRVNDGVREMRQLTETFLADFSNPTTSPEFCVRNFTNSCRGKQAELEDIRNARRLVTIVSATYRIETIALNSGWPECTAPAGPQNCAVSVSPVHWVSIIKETGQTKHDIGDAVLSGVFEGRQWWLCDSRFFPTQTTAGVQPLVR